MKWLVPRPLRGAAGHVRFLCFASSEVSHVPAARDVRVGSRAGIAPTLATRLLYPRIAAEVVALPKSSALCTDSEVSVPDSVSALPVFLASQVNSPRCPAQRLREKFEEDFELWRPLPAGWKHGP